MSVLDDMEEMQRRREMIRTHVEKTRGQDDQLLTKFVKEYTCTFCKTAGRYQIDDGVLYTDPAIYQAHCNACRSKISFGFSSTPLWSINENGAVVDVSGRTVVVHHKEPVHPVCINVPLLRVAGS